MMKLDVAVQAFDMQDISNRRFMYNPKTGILVLGRQYGQTRGLPGSHADDLAQAGIRSGFDDFVRGWVGTGKNYPAGIIHFAPNVDAQNISLFNRAFDTLEMFQRNGALPDTVVRGFGRQWEQALSEVLSPAHNERISNQEESMEIQNITVEDLRRMEDKEGLVLQGCGGDPGDIMDGLCSCICCFDIAARFSSHVYWIFLESLFLQFCRSVYPADDSDLRNENTRLCSCCVGVWCIQHSSVCRLGSGGRQRDIADSGGYSSYKHLEAGKRIPRLS